VRDVKIVGLEDEVKGLKRWRNYPVEDRPIIKGISLSNILNIIFIVKEKEVKSNEDIFDITYKRIGKKLKNIVFY